MILSRNTLDNVKTLTRIVNGVEYIVDVWDDGESWSCWIDGVSCIRRPVHTDMLNKAGIEVEDV